MSSRSSRVSFATVSVRHYARSLSDHPDANGGPPIGISWEYIEEGRAKSLGEYELTRRKKKAVRLTSKTRAQVLEDEWGVSPEEMRLAELEARKTHICRMKTQNQSRMEERAEELVQSVRRKIGRLVHRKK
jgi:hypothetical protein